MGGLMKMLACHCVLLVAVLLSTCSLASPDNQSHSSNAGVSTTKPMKSPEELTTVFDMSTDLSTEAILPEQTTTVTISTETSTTSAAAAVTTTEKPLTESVTTKEKTTPEDISTSKKVTAPETPATSKIPSSSTKSTTESQPQVATKKHGTSDKPISTTKHTDSPTDSSFLGVDKNSFTAKVILPIAAGIILAVFIVLIVCSIRSCLDRKERKSSRRTLDHDMAPMDRVMLLADSSEDEF